MNDPDNNTKLPWHDPTHGRIDRDIQEYVNELSPRNIGSWMAIANTLQTRRDIARERAIEHARQHPISDSGVHAHSILTPDYEPNRPMAPFTGDLVEDTFEKPSYVALVVSGICLSGIAVIITWMIVMLG
jgi:hypothetical protein